MGSYDTVHAGTRCGQTKALGKSLRDLLVGDEVRCYPVAMNAKEFEAEMRGEVPAHEESTFAVRMPAGGFLIVRDNVITDWSNTVAEDVAVFDNFGRRIDRTLIDAPSEGATVSDIGQGRPHASDHVTCPLCHKIRAEGPAAVAQQRAKARAERQAQFAAQRAENLAHVAALRTQREAALDAGVDNVRHLPRRPDTSPDTSPDRG